MQRLDRVDGEELDETTLEARVLVARCQLQKAYTCSTFQLVKDPSNRFRLADTSASDF